MRITRLDVRAEHGITMVAVMVVMTVATMVASAVLLAAQGDLPFSKASSDRKQANAAAESGIAYYLYQLSRDNDYWTKCDDVPAPAPVHQKWNGNGTDPRAWRTVPGTASQYTLELLPAPGQTSCEAGKADTTLLDAASGTFRIRSTGRVGKVHRSIIATFRRSSFLDFLYFTDKETFSPEVYTTTALRDAAKTTCDQYERDGRPTPTPGNPLCATIQFISSDANRGPFHTNDQIRACGNYTLGRSKADKIQIVGSPKVTTPGTSGACQAGAPNYLGTVVNQVKTLPMPSTNASLKARAGVLYTGRTWIRFHSGVMDVTTWPGGVKTEQLDQPVPANGVIFVQSKPGTCSNVQPPTRQEYTEESGCGNVTVYGTYSKSLTIASEKDIVVGAPVDPVTLDPIVSSADLKRSGDVVLGLIADKFVRVSHAVNRDGGDDDADGTVCDNRRAPDGNWTHDIDIEAAILGLTHSFIVDNHDCGKQLGTLKVTGAIAQKFRGPVGQSTTYWNGSSYQLRQSGYTKSYNYDDRLRFRSPPFFLNPVDAEWLNIRQNEQVPAIYERP